MGCAGTISIPQDLKTFQATELPSPAPRPHTQPPHGPPGLATHVVQDCGPPFHGDALEDGQHSEEDVVELRDPVVGTDPLPALVARGATLHPARVGGVQLLQLACGHRAEPKDAAVREEKSPNAGGLGTEQGTTRN